MRQIPKREGRPKAASKLINASSRSRNPTARDDTAYTRRPVWSNRVGSRSMCRHCSSCNSGDGGRTNQRMPAARRYSPSPKLTAQHPVSMLLAQTLLKAQNLLG